jgi:hypothetical protein
MVARATIEADAASLDADISNRAQKKLDHIDM